MNENIEKKQNWLERNPKKTLLIIIIIPTLLITFLTEKYLGYRNVKHGIKSGVQREIRLREHPPLSMLTKIPYDADMKESEGLVQKEYSFRVDENGFIEPSKKYDNPDASIFFLGGSTTECEHMDEKNRFPYIVGELLEENLNKKINSFNGGVSGNNSLHSIDILINKVIPLNPDIVVLMHNINDVVILIYEGSYWNKNSSRSPLLYKTFSLYSFVKELKDLLVPNIWWAFKELWRTKVSEAIQDEFAERRGQTLKIDSTKFINEFKMNLRMFSNICEARDIVPVLMTQAHRFKINPDDIIKIAIENKLGANGIEYKEFKMIIDRFNETIREVGKEENVLVIDLEKEIPKEKEYMYDGVHYNDYGSRYASEIISQKLSNLIQMNSVPNKNN
jgi:hypothetical protein